MSDVIKRPRAAFRLLSVLLALTPVAIFYIARADAQHWRNERSMWPRGWVTPDPVLGWRTSETWDSIATHRHGFRAPIPTDGGRILALGCSFTYGAWVDHPWPERVGALNAGCIGWGLAQMVIRAKELAGLKPDIVIVEAAPWLAERSMSPAYRFTDGWAACPWFDTRLEIQAPVASTDSEWAMGQVVRQDWLRLRAMTCRPATDHVAVEEIGYRELAALFPGRLRIVVTVGRAWPDARAEALRLTRRLSTIAPTMDSMVDQCESTTWDGHPGEHGHEIIAMAVAPWVERKP